MAITLPDIPELLFSSQLPDRLLFSCDDESMLEIRLKVGAYIIFQTELRPYHGNLYFYNAAQMFESYFVAHNLTLENCFIQCKQEQDITYSQVSFELIFCNYFTPIDIAAFVDNNFFLSSQNKSCGKDTTEFLHFFLMNGAAPKIYENIIFSYQGNPPQSLMIDWSPTMLPFDRIYTVEVTHQSLLEAAANSDNLNIDQIEIKACSVTVGKRCVSLYFDKWERQLPLFFRNAFNLWENCQVTCKTARKANTSRDIAAINSESVVYNTSNSMLFEVEAAPLPYDDACALEQALFSHDVRLAPYREDASEESFGEYVPDNFPKIIITEFSFEPSDVNGALCSLKFSFRLASNYSPLAEQNYITKYRDRIFTAHYFPYFS